MVKVREAGFTLVELLVTLALMSFIAVTLTATFQMTRRAVRTINESNERAAVATIQAFVIESLKQMFPVLQDTNGLHRGVYFTGREQAIAFVSNYAGGGTIGGLHAVLLEQRPPQNGLSNKSSLILQVKVWRPLPDGKSEVYERILLENINSFGVQYFDGDRSIWHQQWPYPNRLPDLLKLSVEFPKGDIRQWPVTVVSPRIER